MSRPNMDEAMRRLGDMVEAVERYGDCESTRELVWRVGGMFGDVSKRMLQLADSLAETGCPVCELTAKALINLVSGK